MNKRLVLIPLVKIVILWWQIDDVKTGVFAKHAVKISITIHLCSVFIIITNIFTTFHIYGFKFEYNKIQFM